MYPTSKHFHAHCAVISDEYITDKVQNQGGGNTVSVQCSNSPLLVKNNAIHLFNEHWYLSVTNAEVHDGTLIFITAIKLSDTDNVVVVGTDVNLLILLSNVFIIAMPSCVSLELVIFIVPLNRLNGFHNTSTSSLKVRHLN